jgi:hypothetical protein
LMKAALAFAKAAFFKFINPTNPTLVAFDW